MDKKVVYNSGFSLGQAVSQVVLKNITKKIVQSFPEGMTPEITRGLSIDDARELSQEFSEVISQQVFRDLSQWISSEHSREIAQKIFSDMNPEGIQGISKQISWGILEQAEKTAKRMITSGRYSQEEICELSGLSPNYVRGMLMERGNCVS